MAFVTNYTYYNLIEEYDELIDDEFMDSIKKLNWKIDHLIKYLDIDKKDFTLYKLVKHKRILFYKYIEEYIDDKKFVYRRGGKFVYHLYGDCEKLVEKYLDYKIPPEVSGSGSEMVKAFREWFVDKFENSSPNNNEIGLCFNKEFATDYKLEEVGDFDFKFERQRAEINEVDQYFSTKEFNLKMNEVLKLNHNLKIGKIDQDNILDIKFKGIELIHTLVKWMCQHPKKNNEVLVLDDFSLRCCQVCYSKHKEIFKK